MAEENQNLSMFAGETRTVTVTATNDSTGELIDFTGATITWALERNGTSVLSKTVGSGITVTGTGTFTISITAANSTGLSGDYEHEARTTLADGTVATLFTGTVHVRPTII